MNKKALSPILSVLGALLLAIVVGVFSASPFGERNVAHAQASDDARLGALSITSVSFMSPTFDAATVSYRARASSSTSTVSVSATARNSQSMVDIELSGESDNEPGTRRKTQSITLDDAGSPTTITVAVTSPADTTMTYTIVVFRESVAAEAEAGAVLTAWGLNTVVDGGNDTDLLSAVDVSLKASAANVGHDISKLYFTATGSDDSHIEVKGLHYNESIPNEARVPIDLNRKGLKTVFTITVTSEDGGSSNTYTVTAYRYRESKSNVNTLNRLSLGSGIRLMPSFSSSVTDYEARVPYDIGDGTVTYTSTDTAGGVRIDVSGIDDADPDTSAHEFRLAPGANSTITVKVAAEASTTADLMAYTCDGTDPNVKCYEVVVYRENLTKLSDKTLSGLAVVDTAASGAPQLGTVQFDSEVTKYTNNAVANTVGQVRVTPTLTDTTGGAKYVIDPPDDVVSSEDTHEVNLTAGQMKTITITVTAEDGTMETYTVVLYRMRAPDQISDDARLKSLRVTDSSDMDQVLDPTFDSGRTMYDVTVAYSANEVTIVPETFEFGANFEYEDASGSPRVDDNIPASGYQVILVDGAEPTEVNVVVTAEDEMAATKTYTVMLYRENSPLTNDASLESLTLSPSGMRTPTAFAPATTDYRVVVGNGVPSVSVSVTPMEPGADYGIEPDDEDSNNDGHQIIATVGTEKVITVTVTAEDGTTTKTYTVALYRERAPRSDDATLSALSLDNAALLPAFSPDLTTYTASALGSAGEYTTLTYAVDAGAAKPEVWVGRSAPTDTTTTDPLAATTRSGATVRLYNTGETVITIAVTAENGITKKTYTITVSRATELSSDATLSSLMLSGVTLMPEFASGTMEYTAMVANDVEMTTVSATKTHPGATITGDGNRTLVVGENTIRVTVTAEDGTSQTYTVTVTRAAELGMDASLTSLSLMDGMGMDITLVAGVAAHWNTLDCPAMNDRVGADDEPDDMTSPYCRMYDGLDDAAKMVVDATYDEDPIEGFMSDINMYYASAASDVEMIKVMATAMDSDAMVSVMYGADDMMAMMDDDGYYSVSVMEGENTVKVMVTAEDGTTMMTYTVMVTIAMPTLLDRYDADNSGDINLTEVSAAIDDYFATPRLISLDEVSAVIDLYFQALQ